MISKLFVLVLSQVLNRRGKSTYEESMDGNRDSTMYIYTYV